MALSRPVPICLPPISKRLTGHSPVGRTSSRRACPVFLPSATFAPVTSSVLHQQSAKDPLPSRLSNRCFKSRNRRTLHFLTLFSAVSLHTKPQSLRLITRVRGG